MKININNYNPRQEQIENPWGDEPLFVRELLGGQLELIQRYSRSVNGTVVVDHQIALLIVCSLVDEEGNYVFKESDIESLENQPASTISKLIEVIGRISNLKV